MHDWIQSMLLSLKFIVTFQWKASNTLKLKVVDIRSCPQNNWILTMKWKFPLSSHIYIGYFNFNQLVLLCIYTEFAIVTSKL